MPDVAPVTTTARPESEGGGPQPSSLLRRAMPTRLKLGATVASATASTASATQRLVVEALIGPTGTGDRRWPGRPPV